jgi:hypothetical protein
MSKKKARSRRAAKVTSNNITNAVSKTKKNCKNKSSSKHSNKFAKLNEDYLSKSYLTKSCVMASSLSSFSIANMNNVNFNNYGKNHQNAKRLKCLLVGDARVGKSALMILFLKKIFKFEYQPTIVDDYEGKQKL